MKTDPTWTAASTRLADLKEAERVVHYQASAPAERWRQVLELDGGELKQVCVAMKKMLDEQGLLTAASLFAPIPYYLYYSRHGYFVDESDVLAREGGISPALMAFLQRQYTWSHAACTTASVFDAARNEMVMLRSLDWPGAEALAKATRLHEFRDSAGKVAFRSVGLTGMVGVLTGVRPGGYSIALNFARARVSIRPAADPTLMMRKVLEDPSVDSFAAAKLAISKWSLGAPCFISLCGVRKGEACVFEFLRGGAHKIRDIGDAHALVQANHYDEDNAERQADDELRDAEEERLFQSTLDDSSARRRRQVEERLGQWSGGASGESLVDAAQRIWSEAPVRNFETAYFAVMRPSVGEARVSIAARR